MRWLWVGSMEELIERQAKTQMLYEKFFIVNDFKNRYNKEVQNHDKAKAHV